MSDVVIFFMVKKSYHKWEEEAITMENGEENEQNGDSDYLLCIV
jgi:hypothetical protein